MSMSRTAVVNSNIACVCALLCGADVLRNAFEDQSAGCHVRLLYTAIPPSVLACCAAQSVSARLSMVEGSVAASSMRLFGSCSLCLALCTAEVLVDLRPAGMPHRAKISASSSRFVPNTQPMTMPTTWPGRQRHVVARAAAAAAGHGAADGRARACGRRAAGRCSRCRAPG